MRRLSWLVMMSVLITPPLARAQESKTPDTGPGRETKVVDPIVVTATKVETPQSQIGATVTVVTEEELRTFNQDQFQEALRTVPGVQIERFGGLGKAATIRIRGSDPAQIQVLVDGMRVKSPTVGAADPSELSLDAVDRIEVVRGPQSTLYGADALAGVVNVITKKGAGPPRATLAVEGGSYETSRESLNVQGALGAFNFNVSGSHYDTRGNLRRFNNDDSTFTAFAGRIGYDFPWKGSFWVTGRYSRLDADLPVDTPRPPVTIFDPNSQQQTETWLFTLNYTQPITEWWDVRLRYGQFARNVGFQDPPPPEFDAFGATESLTRDRRLEAEVLTSFKLGTWNTLTIGGEYRDEFGFTRGTFSGVDAPLQKFRKEIVTKSLLGEDQIRLWDRLFVTGGVRYEDNDTFGESVTGRVSAAVAVKETGTTIRGAWGEGFRAPSVDDLLFPGFGNPSLKPERSESYEVGFDQRFWDNRVRFGATYFHTTFRDLIVSTQVPISAEAPFGFLPENVGRARTEGLETHVELEPIDRVMLYANYTWLRPKNLITGRDLPNRSRHTWNTGIVVTPIERLTLFVQAHVASSRFVSEFSGTLPGWFRIDTGGTYRLLGRTGRMERLELTLRIENLTNERYEEIIGWRQPGFNALLGLRVAFQ
ncbi:MAG: hypothetical protein DMD91_05825 [Candidatus Rokuibacteriota bacterium]|nr:MAG: hypothetical protein DMD91_05825 [Candidatus Rokubacteria bacterium]